MRVTISGRRSAVEPRRSDPNASPGSLLGEKWIACYRCGREFRASELREIRRGSGNDSLFVCEGCFVKEVDG